MPLEQDHFDRLRGETRASLKIQRSEFIGISFPIESENDFHHALEALAKEMYDATHHCWAFRLREEDEVRQRSADAGEPSGTAGRPILQALEDADLLDSAVVVVRYYGGVKLGTGGLARAYRGAARESIAQAPRERRYLYERIECAPGFDRMNQIYAMVEPPDVILVQERFEPEPMLTIDVRRSRAERVLTALREQQIRFE